MSLKLTVAAGALAASAGALGAWALFGGSQAPVDAGLPAAFAKLSAADRHAWLSVRAVAAGASLDANLPKSGEQPHMRVTEHLVNPKLNAIQLRIEVSGPYGLDPALAEQTTTAFYEMLCPGYVASELGQNRTTILHNFYGREDQGTLSFMISPKTCRGSA